MLSSKVLEKPFTLITQLTLALTVLFATGSFAAAQIISEVRISASSDDAEESASGWVSLASSDLELVHDRNDQAVGIRFVGVDLPQSATVLNAYVQFQVDETDSETTSLVIEGEAVDHAETFSSTSRNVSLRVRTSATVAWSPTEWTSVGEAGWDQRTPDLSAVIQELVDRPGWSSGNALVLIVTGTGARTAEAYDGNAQGAPLLHLEYAVGPVNHSPTVTTTLPINNSAFDVGENITFTGNADDEEDGDITSSLRWVSDVDGEIGSGGLFTYTALSVGMHRVTAVVTDSGGLAGSAEISITVNSENAVPVISEIRISASSDDAEESTSGWVSLTSSDLELVYDRNDQTVGMRFTGVDVPHGATVLNAHVQFQVDETDSETTSLVIEGEAVDHAETFSSTYRNVSLRLRTAAAVAWSPAEWTSVGEAGSNQRTPDLSLVIQELVDRPGWSSGNALVLIVTGTGVRTAEACDGNAQGAPLLHLEYVVGPVNQPPSVNITLPTNNFAFDVGGNIAFTGSADDEEDGDIASGLTWESDCDGVIGAGESFSRSDLSVGVHRITATVTDSGSQEGSSQVSITVGVINATPMVSIHSPADAMTFSTGEAIQFTGNATDPEDGDLTSSLSWTSDVNGLIGTGGSFTTSDLSAGAHTITASVADSGSRAGFDAVTFSVLSDATILVGAGDIAVCDSERDEETARLLDDIAGRVFTLGDNAYPDGTPTQFSECYDPTWGRHKKRTRPSLGSHDYHFPDAAGYFDYFGEAAGEVGKGYYSYDAGPWHIVVLNSECSEVGGCDRTSLQGLWLQADLAANRKDCTLAYGHVPRFSSGPHGGSLDVQDLWEILYEAGADVVLSGHDHGYERFAPQDPNGVADPVRGIRQFVVGTGGGWLYTIDRVEPNSEVRNDTTFGVLKLTLHTTGYDWEFVPVEGSTFTDSGSGSCVITPPPNQAPTVTVDSPADGSTFLHRDSINFTASATDFEDGDVTSSIVWTSDLDGLIGNGGSFSKSDLSVGIHMVTVVATDSESVAGVVQISITVTPPPGNQVTQVRISTSSDDAEESTSGWVSLTSSDLELVHDRNDQVVGMRFAGVDVPQGATILNAQVQFQVDETDSETTSLVIEGEAVDHAETFSSTYKNVSLRGRTSAAVVWVPAEWTSVGETGANQQTPDISVVIQEVVDRSGWSSGNALVLIVTGTGARTAEAYDGKAQGAPLLHIEYLH